MLFAYQAGATAGPKVSELGPGGAGNKHNLSAKAWSGGSYTGFNPNKYKADDVAGKGQQICIFCHTPHSANVEGGAPLWNRTFSTATFSRYSSTTMKIRTDSSISSAAGYDAGWQPDGSSKLCLSCHDGIKSLWTLLGDRTIAMDSGAEDVITGLASFEPTTNKMTTGHHPVSFRYDGTIPADINALRSGDGYGYRSSTLSTYVKLDKNGKMQCTTCHNAHQNQTDDTDCYEGACQPTYRKRAPFWVYGASGVAGTDRDDVCTSCHNIATPLPNSPMTP